jgi:myo-inositol-1(or 4)-monophosphatase
LRLRLDILRVVVNLDATSDDVEVAIGAASAGASVVRDLYGQRLTRIDKGAGDFATAADVEAEKVIRAVIRAVRPDDAVLGEEGGQQGAAGAVRQWLVDPLCGTLNYAAGTMLVAVNVALRNGTAAVADPVLAWLINLLLAGSQTGAARQGPRGPGRRSGGEPALPPASSRSSF